MAQWFHYVGGRYTPRKFIEESIRVGFITRRAPANQVKAMHFGDTVVLLDWRKGKPAAFGEFIINGVMFDGKVQQKLVEELKAEDKIVQDDSGVPSVKVERECGDFTMGGGASVREDVDIPEIMEKAERANNDMQGELGLKDESKGSLWCMVKGTLTKTFIPPRTIDPAPPFTRGFMQVPEGTQFIASHADEHVHNEAERTVTGVGEYERAWE
ncbi:MAG TPA: hypothetical protein VFD70_30900 [Anaerolineae bacterium]|nr:hypothetical protein [Anaerolineae bacterium]